LPQAAETVVLRARSSGFVNQIQTEGIGQSALLLGAGRAAKEDRIDPAVGVKMLVRLGDRIEQDDEIGLLLVNNRKNLDRAVETVHRSIIIGEQRTDPPPLIYD
jgi:pyrimidine-nucleoside phosphorylase